MSIFKHRPYVDGGKVFHGGNIMDFDGDCEDVTSPVVDASSNERIVIGRAAQMDICDGESVLQSAKWRGTTELVRGL